ncbi:6-phosphofructokinase [Desulfospira joergensenii]|uniref:6-phosphofructokinase n=1 Tax=Desulfospira joergensenii TaxID=53329 RepID=UPI0003B671C5|nr:6-phosphofructokinase [Desulfospira joergensenii]
MKPQPGPKPESILNHPLVKEAVADINPENIERRSFIPQKIKVFTTGDSCLEEKEEFKFTLHKEARRILPDIIDNSVQKIVDPGDSARDQKKEFKRKTRIGVVFSGGPAPGGHNVIAGLFDAIKSFNPDSQLFGFLKGPDGILESRYIEITRDLVDRYRNMGGFSMIRTGRTKIDSRGKMDLALQTCRNLGLDGLVIIGGDDSNTNAAFLAQHFKSSGIKVIGVPKTIDGDIQVKTNDGQTLCAISFGFHSAARGFSQNIASLASDAGSTTKYWHVCKVMGRVASHLTLETALQTHANLSLIGEELADYVNRDRLEKAEEGGIVDYNAFGITLRHLSRLICNTIVRRAAFGKNYGIIIIPEGILEFINEIQVFIIKLNKIIADYNHIHDISFHLVFPGLKDKLEYLRHISQGMVDNTPFPIWNLRDDELFNQLPSFFQEGLLVERDLHGNFQFSQVKTEKIIMDMVKEYLGVLKEQGRYKIGIDREEYKTLMDTGNLDLQSHAKALFKDPLADFLLVRESIISLKTLKQALVSNDLLGDEEEIPRPVVEIFKKSQPEFKTQTHFYGYDGRGSDPTQFDCTYTYNLGFTAFHLIANGSTGQMAAIKNLEKDFSQWEPIGIPIARLMHLEERKGRLELVMEKALVDLDSNAFKVFKMVREKWVAAKAGPDAYRRPGPIRFSGRTEEDRPITLMLSSLDG